VAASPEAPAPRRRGRPPRTDEQRAAHRTRLVEAAIGAIRAQGPDVSIDDLAAAAGVSKPVLYDEFGGRLGIADAIAVVVAGRLEEQVLSELAERGITDLDLAIRAVIQALVDLVGDEPELYVFLVRAIRNSDRGLLDNALLGVMHDRASLLVGFIAPGVPAAHLRVLTDGLFGFVFAAVESWHTTKEPDRRELVDTLTDVIRTGFANVAEQQARRASSNG
jgi:AcrR family transcriptional regulator